MRHLKRKRNLGISPSHRSSLLANLATSVLDKERLVTTLAKAKEVRGLVERLITYGKRGGLHQIRLAARTVTDKDVLHKLFSDIAPAYKDREGGYTRIIKIGERKGDNAFTAMIELVGRSTAEIARLRKKQRKAPDGAPEPKEAKAEAQQEAAEKPEKPAKEAKPKKERAEPKKKEPAKEKKPKEEKAEAPAEEKKEKPAKAPKAEGEKKKAEK